MGVRGLQTLMVNGECPNGSKNVKIIDLINEYRALYGDNRILTIVVDGCSCINKLYGDLCWVMGGQWNEYLRILERFVDNFRKLGVKLVFFFDGPTMPEKRATWVSRRLNKMKTTKNVFATIRDGRMPTIDDFHFPSGMTTVTRMALKFICKCEVLVSRKECDVEIATYAKKNNCLAILAQDSDYIIFDTVPYLSISDLNLSTMTTLQYDRRALVSWLGLRINQLPLFACLVGNDEIPFDSLRSFRLYIDSRNLGRFKPVAEFMRSHWKLGTEPDLSKIAAVAFGDERKAKLLKKASESYRLNIREKREPLEPTDVPELIISRHVNCESLSSIAYAILDSATIDSTNSLEEDERSSAYPPASLLYRAVRQRCYYVLQSARKPNERINVVEEWCAYPGNSLTAPEKVKPIRFNLPEGVSTIRDLWLGTPELTGIHLESFLSCFGVAFDYEVDYVPQKYFVFCCIVNFLTRNITIDEWQIDAFIAQATILNTTNVEFLQRLRISEYNADAVQLATLFMNGVDCAWRVLTTCSYPLDVTLAMPWNFFDGKLFHRCYLRAMTSRPIYTDGDMKSIDSDLFGAIKRMCLSKKTLV